MAESDVKPADQQITLSIVMGSDAPVKLKVKRGTKFVKIFKAFYTNKGIAEKTVKFSFNGTVLGEEDTPDDLEMDDGDQIDAMVQQTGGC